MKEVIAIGLLVFWLCFPMPFIFMNYNNILVLDTTFLEYEKPTTFNYLLNFSLWDYISIYFQILFLYIPTAPLWLNLVTTILKFISALIIFLLIRGN